MLIFDFKRIDILFRIVKSFFKICFWNVIIPSVKGLWVK